MQRGFGTAGGATYLLAYQVHGEYVYAQGISDNPNFAISGSAESYLVKNSLDFADTSCFALGAAEISLSFSDGAATVLDSNSIPSVAIQSPSETLDTTIPSTAAPTTTYTLENVCSTITSPAVNQQTVYRGYTLSFALSTAACTTAVNSISYTALENG